MVGYLVAVCESSCKDTPEDCKSVSNTELKVCSVTDNFIECMKQSFKTQRSAFNFDTGFCKITSDQFDVVDLFFCIFIFVYFSMCLAFCYFD